MARGAAGFAHGELDEAPAAPADDGGSDDVLDLDEGTVVSLVERRREEAEDMGIGDAAGRPEST